MKVKAESLSAELSRRIAPIYVIAGDEPLLTGEAASLIRISARAQGYAERTSYTVERANDFKWQEFAHEFATLSLFADKKIIELRLPGGKPGRQGIEALAALARSPAPDKLLLLHLPYLNRTAQASQWVKALQGAGVWVDVLPPDDLHAWIAARAKRAGLNCDSDALSLLTERIEGNLLAAQQELDKLLLLADGKTVDLALISRSVADGAHFDVYQLADAALNQNFRRAARILFGLRREGCAEALVTWSLVTAARTLADVWAARDSGMTLARALTAAGVWTQKEPAYRRALAAHSERSVRELIRQAAATDRIVKGRQYGLPWHALLHLVLQLARPQPSAALKL